MPEIRNGPLWDGDPRRGKQADSASPSSAPPENQAQSLLELTEFRQVDDSCWVLGWALVTPPSGETIDVPVQVTRCTKEWVPVVPRRSSAAIEKLIRAAYPDSLRKDPYSEASQFRGAKTGIRAISPLRRGERGRAAKRSSRNGRLTATLLERCWAFWRCSSRLA
jgi:hypothetical protein